MRKIRITGTDITSLDSKIDEWDLNLVYHRSIQGIGIYIFSFLFYYSWYLEKQRNYTNATLILEYKSRSEVNIEIMAEIECEDDKDEKKLREFTDEIEKEISMR
ncbi:MAG: hypothetical protein ACW967_05175, partial [Candidatus Hodarchaeales archaeon]